MVNEFGCQHLLEAAIYNVIAIPIGAGALYPSLGLMLRRNSARSRCPLQHHRGHEYPALAT